jgi:two-component system, sensor histidine kinase RegB
LSATPLGVHPWLVWFRALTAALELAAIVVALAWPHATFPLHHVAPALGVAAVLNGMTAWALFRRGTVPPHLALMSLLSDAVVLTGLLQLTGGPFNPFAVVYAIHVAQAAVALGRLPLAWWRSALPCVTGRCCTGTRSKPTPSIIG